MFVDNSFFTSPKIQTLSEVMQRRLIMIMAYNATQGNVTCNESVTLQSVTSDVEKHLCYHLRITKDELAETKATLNSAGLIDNV